MSEGNVQYPSVGKAKPSAPPLPKVGTQALQHSVYWHCMYGMSVAVTFAMLSHFKGADQFASP